MGTSLIIGNINGTATLLFLSLNQNYYKYLHDSIIIWFELPQDFTKKILFVIKISTTQVCELIKKTFYTNMFHITNRSV